MLCASAPACAAHVRGSTPGAPPTHRAAWLGRVGIRERLCPHAQPAELLNQQEGQQLRVSRHVGRRDAPHRVHSCWVGGGGSGGAARVVACRCTHACMHAAAAGGACRRVSQMLGEDRQAGERPKHASMHGYTPASPAAAAGTGTAAAL